MTITVGFLSEKGGVGKTTTAYHVAIGLRRFHEKRVLVVDTDYQRGGLTCRLIPSMLENFRLGEVTDITLYRAYRALYSGETTLPPLTVLPTSSGVDIVPADPRLGSISVDKMPPTNTILGNNQMLMRHLSLVADALSALPAPSYDYILIDSHPDLSDLERAVIYASDYVVSPVKLDQQSAIGVPSTVEAIKSVNSDVKAVNQMIGGDPHYKDTQFLGAIGMMCREYGLSLKYSEQLIYNRLQQTTGIFNNYVTEGDGLRLAAQEQCAVYDISGANADRQSLQYRSMINELISKIPTP